MSAASIFCGFAALSSWLRWGKTRAAGCTDAKSFPRQLRITNGSTGYSAITCGLAGPFDCAVAYNNDDDDKKQGRKVTLALFSSADVR